MDILADATIAAFLVFCRIGSCIMIMPGLSSARVPMQMRLLMALAISLSLLPIVNDFSQPPAAYTSAGALGVAIFSEAVIGATVGLVARLYLLAIGFMASGMAMAIGLAGIPTSTIDESEPQAALAALISLSILALLFALDFHLYMVRGLADTYSVLPVGTAPNISKLLADITDALTDAFVIVLRLGSPFIAYAILANLAIGLLNKLTPQIPIFFISLPFTIAGGLTLLYFFLPSFLSLGGQGLTEVIGGILK